MANLQRIRVAISGLVGGPGVATFYAQEADTTAVAALSTFYSSVKSLHAQNTSFQIPGTGDVINEANGHIVGVWTQSGGSTQTSASGANPYGAGVGMRIRWFTAGIVHNRRVTGTTFLVPLNGASLDTDGTILDSTVTTVSTAAGTLVSGSALRIWSPPVTAEQATPTVPQRDGSSYEVQGHQVPQMVSWLRSRKV